MKRFLLIALVFLNTSNELVIDDPYSDLDNISPSDIIVFVYESEIKGSLIEVSGPEGDTYSERETSQPPYSLTQESRDALKFFENFYK